MLLLISQKKNISVTQSITFLFFFFLLINLIIFNYTFYESRGNYHITSITSENFNTQGGNQKILRPIYSTCHIPHLFHEIFSHVISSLISFYMSLLYNIREYIANQNTSCFKIHTNQNSLVIQAMCNHILIFFFLFLFFSSKIVDQVAEDKDN